MGRSHRLNRRLNPRSACWFTDRRYDPLTMFHTSAAKGRLSHGHLSASVTHLGPPRSTPS